jgi:hypothetical protein
MTISISTRANSDAEARRRLETLGDTILNLCNSGLPSDGASLERSFTVPVDLSLSVNTRRAADMDYAIRPEGNNGGGTQFDGGDAGKRASFRLGVKCLAFSGIKAPTEDGRPVRHRRHQPRLSRAQLARDDRLRARRQFPDRASVLRHEAQPHTQGQGPYQVGREAGKLLAEVLVSRRAASAPRKRARNRLTGSEPAAPRMLFGPGLGMHSQEMV